MEMDLKELLKLDNQLEEGLKLLKTWNRFQEPKIEPKVEPAKS
jgi:hypothetical protein